MRYYCYYHYNTFQQNSFHEQLLSITLNKVHHKSVLFQSNKSVSWFIGRSANKIGLIAFHCLLLFSHLHLIPKIHSRF